MLTGSQSVLAEVWAAEGLGYCDIRLKLSLPNDPEILAALKAIVWSVHGQDKPLPPRHLLRAVCDRSGADILGGSILPGR